MSTLVASDYGKETIFRAWRSEVFFSFNWITFESVGFHVVGKNQKTKKLQIEWTADSVESSRHATAAAAAAGCLRGCSILYDSEKIVVSLL